MNFSVTVTPNAKKDARQLSKKYRSFKLDLVGLVSSLKENPQQGEPLGKDCYKIRLAIGSKRKGKSGGARTITCVKIVAEQVFIVAIYDKSELATLTDNELKQRLRNAGL